MTRAKLEANIGESRKHVARQEALIVRLTEQGHAAALAEASALLATMQDHLRIEHEMLDQMGPA